MSVIVTDAGFQPSAGEAFDGFEGLADPLRRGIALELGADTALERIASLASDFDRIALIAIPFTAFADGRGFTLARQLRLLGYTGRLRAKGQVIADQYAMARRSGFDEVEIDADLAARQPEAQWLSRAGWRGHDYQARLGTRAAGA